MKKLFLLAASAFLLAGCTIPSFIQKKAGLQVNVTNNEKASVFLDNISLGQTPFSSEDLKPGSHTVKLVPESGDKPTYETTITLNSGNLTVVSWSFGKTLDESGGEVFELSKISNKSKAELSLVTSPDNIIVKIDGQSKGFSPLILDDLAEGAHALTLTAPGYVERTSSPKLVKGYRLTVTTKLAHESTDIQLPETSGAPTPSPTPSTKPSAKSSPKPTIKPSPTATSSAKVSVNVPFPYVEIQTTTTGWLRVRTSADSASAELAKLDVGTKVPYLNETASGWLKVEYEKGKEGWVSGQFAMVHNE